MAAQTTATSCDFLAGRPPRLSVCFPITTRQAAQVLQQADLTGASTIANHSALHCDRDKVSSDVDKGLGT